MNMSYTYNIWKNYYIWILDEEVFCPKCNGKGAKIYASVMKSKKRLIKCSFCNGKGKLDWISKIMGKESIYEEKHVYRKNKFES